MKNKSLILFFIVIAQFCCTSLWFAGNAVLPNLISVFNLPDSALSLLTSAVQFGFVIGTLVFAFTGWSDRYESKQVFFVCAILGATSNFLLLYLVHSLYSLILFRFFTGFFLAGIYPVGIKLAAQHFGLQLGKAMGFLVGALVLGTAFPHFIGWVTVSISWKWVLFVTGILSAFGGILIYVGLPQVEKMNKGLFQPQRIFEIFTVTSVRNPAFAYFGHMWELYTFWAFLPVILFWYFEKNNLPFLQVPMYSFLIISIGSLSCVVAGIIAQSKKKVDIAKFALIVSGLCCLLSPLVLFYAPFALFIAFLMIWGASVIADSPMLSALVAENADSAAKGSIITLVNSIGFSLTIVSIIFTSFLKSILPLYFVLFFLAVGPFFGLYFLYKNKRNEIIEMIE